MTMEQTAVDSYGFQSYTPAYPGGLAVSHGTDIQFQGIPAEVSPKLGFGHQNPLFWVLILFLVLLGYMAAGFNFSLKRIFSLKGKVG